MKINKQGNYFVRYPKDILCLYHKMNKEYFHFMHQYFISNLYHQQWFLRLRYNKVRYGFCYQNRRFMTSVYQLEATEIEFDKI